jgi:peptide deformylase
MNATEKLALVPATDAILRATARDVTSYQDEVVPHLAAMRDLMAVHNGVGLAAPQVGIGLRFFITSLPGIKVVLNPRIICGVGGRVSKLEGCLSFPGRNTYVARHAVIEAEWTDRWGALHRQHLRDWPARVFQHETDHLNGVCIFTS